jgi:hypothetical protein
VVPSHGGEHEERDEGEADQGDPIGDRERAQRGPDLLSGALRNRSGPDRRALPALRVGGRGWAPFVCRPVAESRTAFRHDHSSLSDSTDSLK